MRRNIIQSASLFLSFLAVVSFSACSNDDGSGIEVPKEPVDAYLSIVATPETLTRSVKSAEQVPFDEYINTLTALVFTEGGDFYTQKTVSSIDNDGKSVSEITGISVKVLPDYENPDAGSSTKFQVVLIANEGPAIENNSVKNIADLSTKIMTPSIDGLGDGKSYLPMSSAILTVTGLKYNGDENWIDGNDEKVKYDKGQATAVSLTRLVSQVKLGSVAVKFKDNFYNNADFIIDEVYLVNVRDNAYFLPSSINDALDETVESEGESYENSTSDFFRGGPETFTTEDGLIANNDDNSTYNKELYALSLGEKIRLKNGERTQEKSFAGFSPYVYPSVVREGEYQTRLVLSCRYRFQEALDYTQKYFHVVIGNKDELGGDATQAYSGIVANSVYTIDVTITGEGSPTPDKYIPTAELTVNMTVEPWHVEHQKEED